MNLMKITTPSAPEGSVRTGNGTKFEIDGVEVPVSRAVVTFAPDAIITATVDVPVVPGQPFMTVPVLSLESVEAFAKHYGHELVPADVAEKIRKLLGFIETLDDPEPGPAVFDPVAAHYARSLSGKTPNRG